MTLVLLTLVAVSIVNAASEEFPEASGEGLDYGQGNGDIPFDNYQSQTGGNPETSLYDKLGRRSDDDDLELVSRRVYSPACEKQRRICVHISQCEIGSALFQVPGCREDNMVCCIALVGNGGIARYTIRDKLGSRRSINRSIKTKKGRRSGRMKHHRALYPHRDESSDFEISDLIKAYKLNNAKALLAQVLKNYLEDAKLLRRFGDDKTSVYVEESDEPNNDENEAYIVVNENY